MIKTDNEVWAIIMQAINGGLALRGFNAEVIQAFQPVQEGVTLEPLVTVNSITSKRYGWPEDTSFFDEEALELRRREGYWLERTYQVNALQAMPDVTSTGKTAFDYIDAVAAILQTSSVLEFFRNNGIGMLRIEPLRVTYWLDDKEQQEQTPSFDFTLTYRQTTEATGIEISQFLAIFARV
jgi:hypothetical protein